MGQKYVWSAIIWWCYKQNVRWITYDNQEHILLSTFLPIVLQGRINFNLLIYLVVKWFMEWLLEEIFMMAVSINSHMSQMRTSKIKKTFTWRSSTNQFLSHVFLLSLSDVSSFWHFPIFTLCSFYLLLLCKTRKRKEKFFLLVWRGESSWIITTDLVKDNDVE